MPWIEVVKRVFLGLPEKSYISFSDALFKLKKTRGSPKFQNYTHTFSVLFSKALRN